MFPLQSWLEKSLPVSVQMVFHEDSPTCTGMLDVFSGQGELTILLLHLADLHLNYPCDNNFYPNYF